MKQLLTIDQVAELLQIPKASLYRQRSAGLEPGSLGFRIGNAVRFDPDDLDAYTDRQRAHRRRSTANAIPDTSSGHRLMAATEEFADPRPAQSERSLRAQR